MSEDGILKPRFKRPVMDLPTDMAELNHNLAKMNELFEFYLIHTLGYPELPHERDERIKALE